jgi:ribosomal-protein-alanine N-acetyltransferase
MYIVAENFNQDYAPGFYLSLHSFWSDGLIVAKKEGEILGFIIGCLTDSEEARILIMAVEKRYRVKGIGTALLREFMERCALRGLKRIALEVRISNEPAQKFYTRFGFELTNKLPRYHLDGEDAFKMMKWL